MAEVMVWTQGGGVSRNDLEALLAADDGLREDADAIRATIARGGIYRGGGGAGLEFVILPVEPEEVAEARRFIGAAYAAAVGYDPFQDDPAISIAEVAFTLGQMINAHAMAAEAAAEAIAEAAGATKEGE